MPTSNAIFRHGSGVQETDLPARPDTRSHCERQSAVIQHAPTIFVIAWRVQRHKKGTNDQSSALLPGGPTYAPPMIQLMSEVARLLTAIGEGDPQATSELLPLVYRELRRLARAKMAQESSSAFRTARRPASSI